jgi:hypothetical protein
MTPELYAWGPERMRPMESRIRRGWSGRATDPSTPNRYEAAKKSTLTVPTSATNCSPPRVIAEEADAQPCCVPVIPARQQGGGGAGLDMLSMIPHEGRLPHAVGCRYLQAKACTESEQLVVDRT